MTGLFLSFEGVDGSGKTTQVALLSDYLRDRGHKVVVTREPGGTALGTGLRGMLLQGAGDAPIQTRAEALLFAADRAQHVGEVIAPALERGDVVVCDRYIDSSLAYQAGGRELTVDEVRRINMWACGGLLPDRTYLLDIDPGGAMDRLDRRRDRMESAGEGFRARTRASFLGLARREPGRFLVLDAGRPRERLAALIRADVDALLSGGRP
ncbi:dTMP kinase [uncultured Bifidobacterium sp.]|uniref:dTMP kinase n=1 Tax=uncultured Bifidobacterium sp. TaxID=165187 RepID=UPI0028DC8B95|nr:dTMP kinase [uncultured Bifidobacterium sp.]